jgi:signal transduction histidine kinase
MLQQGAENLQVRLACAAVLFLVQQRGHFLTLAACALDLPSQQCPPQLRPSALAANGQSAPLIIPMQQRSSRHNLAVRLLYERLKGNLAENWLSSDSLYDGLRPLLAQTEANRLQQQLAVQQLLAFPLDAGETMPVGVMLIALSHPLDDRQSQLLSSLSQQIALTIRHKQHIEAMTVLEGVTLTLQSRMVDETGVLQTIVDAVVHDLGYAGALVATLEEGRALPVRAYSVDASPAVIQELEKRAGYSLLSTKAVVYLDDERYKDNLSVRAVQSYMGQATPYLLSDHLHDLLRPIVGKPLALFMQRLLHIKKVLAVPFSLEGQVVGNLFVASRQAEFATDELMILNSLSQQAAVGVRNARLYRVAEEQRRIAEVFGRMAFGATASIHKLRNLVGAVRNYMHLLQLAPQIPAEKLHEILADVSLIASRMDQAADLLDSLHQPWQHVPDEPVSINHCLLRALSEVFPLTSFKPIDAQVKTEAGITVSLALSSEMPVVETMLDMLAEAFRIIIKNGAEALANSDPGKKLYVTSTWLSDEEEVVVAIRDEGKGIEPVNLTKIFELGWSTKEGHGMGFGLFWTKDYVRGLGGSITVDSVPGRGTTFAIRLPATVSWEQ